MELTQVKGNTYVLEGEELIPLYLLGGGKCILLDTGLLKEREDLEHTLLEHGLTPAETTGIFRRSTAHRSGSPPRRRACAAACSV